MSVSEFERAVDGLRRAALECRALNIQAEAARHRMQLEDAAFRDAITRYRAKKAELLKLAHGEGLEDFPCE